MRRPDVTHTTHGERISEIETFGAFAIGKAHADWLFGVLHSRTETQPLAADTADQLALEATREIVELEWEISGSESKTCYA